MSTYDSKYTDRKVTAAQYIAEICSERKAKKENRKLNPHFWNEKEWGAFFRRQHTLANNLLKTYSAPAIIQGLSRVKWAYSLATPALITVVETLSKIEEIEVEPEVKVVEQKTEKKQSLFELM